MSDASILDPQALETLRSLNPDDGDVFLKELIEIYLQDTPVHLATIGESLVKNDAPSVMRAAHSIKGSSSNFGATQLAHLAHQVELQGKDGDLTQTGTTLVALQAEYAEVVVALNRILQGT